MASPAENYVLPAGTAVGSYTIEAVYDGTPSYAASLPANSTLTISGATTTTAASNASIGYNSAAQSVPLTATVTSPGGTVSVGTVTFTILNGPTPGRLTRHQPTCPRAQRAQAIRSRPALHSARTRSRLCTTATTDFGGSSDTTHTLTVTQPPAYQLVIHTPPSSAATAGQALASQPVIYEEDQFGNLETERQQRPSSLRRLAAGAGTLLGTATATVVGGIATFTGLGDNTAGTITIKFSSGNLVTTTSATS